MKSKILLLSFICILLLLLFSFTHKQNQIEDKVLLTIVATHQQLPLFNYAVKMAAVDTRPFNPKDKITYPPTTLFSSRSNDSSTHGNKIFKLFAKNDPNYAYDIAQPEGQTLVMQTWFAEKTHTSLGDGKSLRTGDTDYLKPSTSKEFFIMLKSNSKEYATDSGWVYGEVSADGKTVIQKGLVASCMKCHDQSKTDRMLGAR